MAEGGFFKRLLAGLTKTRDNFVKNMDYIFRGFTNIDDEFYEELEEILIMGDIGVTTVSYTHLHRGKRNSIRRSRCHCVRSVCW